MKKQNQIPIPDTPECLASHLGAWAIFPPILEAHVNAFQSGQLIAMSSEKMAANDNSKELYNSFIEDNIQVISISGVMQKKDSKFGGTTSTIKLRKSIRSAANNENIDGVFLHIASPGGTVAGMSELTSEIQALSAKKPVWTFVDEAAFSAGYWIATLGSKIYANPTAQVGSVGVIAMLIDSSKAAENAGLKVIPITTGKLKSFGMPGLEVSKEGIATEQKIIDHYFSMFKDVIVAGRNFSEADFAKIADASWHVAPDAINLKMIDKIADWETAFNEFSEFLADRITSNAATPTTPADPADTEDDLDIGAKKEKISAESPRSIKEQPKTKTLKKGDNLMSESQMKETAAVFTEAFGAKAGEYMAEGLDFKAAAIKHLAAQSEEMTKIKAENEQLKTDIGSETAEKEAISIKLAALKSTAPPEPAASVPLENQETAEEKATREAAEAKKTNTFLGKVKAYKAEHKCDDTVAYSAVSAKHPELWEQHLASQPKKAEKEKQI